eukprot:6405643-Amphidinium_carterae.1
MSHANVFHAKALSNFFFVLDMRTVRRSVFPHPDFCDVVLLSKVHPIQQVLGWLRRRVGSDLKLRTIGSGGFRTWLDTNINTRKNYGRSECEGWPAPAPFGAGRSSGRVAFRAQHDTRGCGEQAEMEPRCAKAMYNPRDWVWERHQWPIHFPRVFEAFPESSIKNLRWAQSRTINGDYAEMETAPFQRVGGPSARTSFRT